MADSQKQMNERTQLLRHSERGPADDAESIISSHVSRDEQMLGETAVGERLPYNDYTTIDWLHDLVCAPDSGSEQLLMCNRSKTPLDIERYILGEAFDTHYLQAGTLVKDG